MKTSNQLYISDTTEEAKYGNTEVLVAGEKETCENYEKAGNQDKKYYENNKEEVKEDKKVGNQDKEYYNE